MRGVGDVAVEASRLARAHRTKAGVAAEVKLRRGPSRGGHESYLLPLFEPVWKIMASSRELPLSFNQ